ncbi:MAG: outer membrane protein assembly factor BamE [Rhodospirillaceae bacterium]|nr:outer membrane protein assembly factor BamE [Rhodospirillaceae bacterium]
MSGMACRHARKTWLAAALAGALAGCTPQLDVRGNLPDPENVLAVQPGITTREQVAQILGSPTAVGTFDDKTWYYISKRTETTAFFDPEVLDQEVLVVKFDDNGVVSDMRLYGDENARQIVPVSRTTPNLGQEMTVLQQLIGNIGRFNRDRESTLLPGGSTVNRY